LDALPHREIAVALKLDFGKIDNQRILNPIFGKHGQSHVVFIDIHADDRP
jgi:hypothetical protein